MQDKKERITKWKEKMKWFSRTFAYVCVCVCVFMWDTMYSNGEQRAVFLIAGSLELTSSHSCQFPFFTFAVAIAIAVTVLAQQQPNNNNKHKNMCDM